MKIEIDILNILQMNFKKIEKDKVYSYGYSSAIKDLAILLGKDENNYGFLSADVSNSIKNNYSHKPPREGDIRSKICGCSEQYIDGSWRGFAGNGGCKMCGMTYKDPPFYTKYGKYH